MDTLSTPAASQSKDMHIRLSGGRNIAIGVNMSLNVC